MKQLKAIEVNQNSVKQLQSEIDIYIETIEELEDLENRSCDNCKKRPSPFSECPCWSYSFGKANISLCSEWEAKK